MTASKISHNKPNDLVLDEETILRKLKDIFLNTQLAYTERIMVGHLLIYRTYDKGSNESTTNLTIDLMLKSPHKISDHTYNILTLFIMALCKGQPK